MPIPPETDCSALGPNTVAKVGRYKHLRKQANIHQRNGKSSLKSISILIPQSQGSKAETMLSAISWHTFSRSNTPATLLQGRKLKGIKEQLRWEIWLVVSRLRSWEECKAANEENNSSNTHILPWTCQTPQTMEPKQCYGAVSFVVMSWRWDSLQSGVPMQIPLTSKASCWEAQLSEEQFYCLLRPSLQIQDQRSAKSDQ